MREQLREMLRRHEGVRNFVYLCSEGYETIGVGRNIADSGLGLSEDEVDFLLDNDIKRVREELNDEYYWFGALNDARQEAMIDISFNLGQTRLRGFKKALDAMSTEDFDRAADEFMDSKWSEQVGNRATEVTEMIRTGEYS